MADDAELSRGRAIDEVLSRHPHVALDRLPNDGPHLNVIERRRRPLPRRARHNGLFDGLADLRRSMRSGSCYFQAVKGRVRRLVARCDARPEDRTLSAVS